MNKVNICVIDDDPIRSDSWKSTLDRFEEVRVTCLDRDSVKASLQLDSAAEDWAVFNLVLFHRTDRDLLKRFSIPIELVGNGAKKRIIYFSGDNPQQSDPAKQLFYLQMSVQTREAPSERQMHPIVEWARTGFSCEIPALLLRRPMFPIINSLQVRAWVCGNEQRAKMVFDDENLASSLEEWLCTPHKTRENLIPKLRKQTQGYVSEQEIDEVNDLLKMLSDRPNKANEIRDIGTKLWIKLEKMAQETRMGW